MNYPLVSIIICNFNGSNFIRKYAKSVFNTKYPNFEILFVDDGSTDNSVELIMSMFGQDPRLRIIRHNNNLGLASARNTGVKAAKGRYIAFLDVDIEVEQDWLMELVKILESDSYIGVVMSKTMDMKDRKRVQCAGQDIIPHIGWTVSRGYGEEDTSVYKRVKEVYSCLNAAIIRREVFEKVGLIDSKMTYLWEDVDFEWRVWLSGYKEVMAPRSIVYHLAKQPRARERMYLWTKIQKDFLFRDSIRFIIKNYEMRNILRYLPWALIIGLVQALRNFKKDSSSFISFAKAIMLHLKSLDNISQERRRIQRHIRRVSDASIFKKVGVKGAFPSIYKEYLLRLRLNYIKYFLR